MASQGGGDAEAPEAPNPIVPSVAHPESGEAKLVINVFRNWDEKCATKRSLAWTPIETTLWPLERRQQGRMPKKLREAGDADVHARNGMRGSREESFKRCIAMLPFLINSTSDGTYERLSLPLPWDKIMAGHERSGGDAVLGSLVDCGNTFELKDSVSFAVSRGHEDFQDQQEEDELDCISAAEELLEVANMDDLKQTLEIDVAKNPDALRRYITRLNDEGKKEKLIDGKQCMELRVQYYRKHAKGVEEIRAHCRSETSTFVCEDSRRPHPKGPANAKLCRVGRE